MDYAQLIKEANNMSLQNSAMSQQFARESWGFNASEAEKSRQWQQYMSDTAYRRAVKDMQLAGLNPALMFGSGSSASVGSGAQASGSAGAVDTSNVGVLGNLLATAINSATTLHVQDMKNAQELAILGKNQQFEEYMRKQYPDSILGVVESLAYQLLGDNFVSVAKDKVTNYFNNDKSPNTSNSAKDVKTQAEANKPTYQNYIRLSEYAFYKRYGISRTEARDKYGWPKVEVRADK